MQHFLMAFYVLFFATGFMGGAALLLLDMRVRSRLLRPLLLFQVLFLLGLGNLIAYFYIDNLPEGLGSSLKLPVLLLISLINTSLYVVAIVLIRRIAPTEKRRSLLPRLVEVFSVLVILKSLANMVLFIALNLNEGSTPSSTAAALSGSLVWNLGGHLLVAAAVGGLGLVFRMPLPAREPPVLKSLMRSYSICALVFAPLGLLEYAVASSGILGNIPFSVDYLFYLGWNIVSMSAAIQLYKTGEGGSPVLDEIPPERVKALGLSNRESEMAVMIARGLSNKEIAAELCISPATVRTHIYNLYQKAGARSRVELINKLRS